jgi:hypothetical protein
VKTYATKSITPVHVDLLEQALERQKVAHRIVTEGNNRTICIGPDSEFEVVVLSRRRGSPKVSISVRYEHPVLKSFVCDWIEKCGGVVHEDFYTSHLTLSPSILKGIKARWCVDLSELPATPVKFGQFVIVLMFGRNVEAELSQQLAAKPHKSMGGGEFIKSAEWSVTGEDPLDTVVYGWRSDAGSQLYVVTASAPAVTMLSLWVISEGVPVETNLSDFITVA